MFAAKPNDRDVVRSYARCLGGWLEETETAPGAYTYTEVTGVGN